MVMQDRLSAAQSLIEEHHRLGSSSEPVVEPVAIDADSSRPQLWLTSFGFWTLVIGNLLAIVGILLFWFIR